MPSDRQIQKLTKVTRPLFFEDLWNEIEKQMLMAKEPGR